MKPKSTLRSLIHFGSTILVAVTVVQATPYYWDTDGATAGAGGATPSGSWTTGGTTWSTSPNGTVATPGYTTLSFDDLFFSAGVGATGSPVITLTSAQDARSLTFQEGTTTISGASGIINLAGTGGNITVNNGAAANIGATTDTIIGGSVGLTKLGVGTLTLNGSLANTFTGGLNVNGGTLALNYANMATPTDLINSGNALGLGGGRLLLTGKSTDTTNQTLGNVTVNSGGGSILGDKNGGTALNITLGTLTTTATGGSLLVGAGGSAANAPVITTTSGTLTNGIYSGRAVYFNGTANTGYDWLTNTGGGGPNYTLSGLAAGNYTALAIATATQNATISATATQGTTTVNSLKFAAPATAQTLTISAGNTLTLGSGGLLFTGAAVAQGPRISGGSITAGNGSGSYDLVVHNYNATNVGLQGSGVNPANSTSINSVIANNGANPVTLVKNGPGALYLGVSNSVAGGFSGGIIVNEGSLYSGVVGALNNNSITFNANATFSTVGSTTDSTNGGIVLNNNSQVTLMNNVGTFNVNGAVTGTGGISIDKGGLGSVTFNLNSTSNTFTGPILFPHRQQNQQAHLTVNSLADTTTLGEGNITFGATPTASTGLSVSQNFNYGTGAIAALTLNNRRIELATVQIAHQINNNSSQAVNINTDLLVSGSTGKILTLGGTGAGLSTFAGTISNHASPTIGTTLVGAIVGANATSIPLASVEGILIGATITASGYSGTINAINPITKTVTINAATNPALGFGATVTIANVVNSVSIAKAGTGTWALSGANTYTGTTAIGASSGILQLGNGGASGSLHTGSAISIGASSTFAVNQSDTVTQGTDFSTAAITGAGGFSQAGSGNTILNAVNTFSGASSVKNGKLTLDGGTNRIGSTSSVVLGDVSTTGKLVLGGTTTADQTLAGLTTTGLGGSVVGGNASNSTLTLTIGTASIFGGTLGGAGTNENNLALTKAGANGLTLSGTHTYTGATKVSAGVLAVNGSLANTTTTVENTGTLQGSGSIGGSVTVQGGGIIAPGNSIESLAVTSLSMATASAFAYEISNNTSTGADLLAVGGTISLTSANLSLDAASIAALSGGSWTLNDKITLISYLDPGSGITSGFNGYLDDTSYIFGTNKWKFDYNDTTAGGNFATDATAASQNHFVTMTLIPEPRAALLGSLGLLVLLRRRR